MRYLVVVFFLLFSGCVFKSLPPLHFYSINSNVNVASVATSPYKNRILKVSPPLSLDTPLDYKIYFKNSNGLSGSYQNSQWQTPLYKQLQRFLIVTLEHSHIFKSVVPIESNVFEDLRLESTIYRLENEISDNTSYAVLDIELRLINMEDRALLKRKRFHYKVQAPTFDATGYIEALNIALERFANDMVAWLAK